jgi:nitrogen fixation protein FixH
MSAAQMSQSPLPEALAQREATARLLWTGGIIAFFVIQAVLWTVAITLTSQDPSHVVLEGYDQRALNWDSWQETVRASAALGWKAELQIGESANVTGQRDLTLRLVDRNGQPVSAAAIDLKLFHRARAAEAETFRLQELLPGEYVTSFRPQHAGIWKFEITATKGTDKFLDVIQLEVPAARASTSGKTLPESTR